MHCCCGESKYFQCHRELETYPLWYVSHQMMFYTHMFNINLFTTCFRHSVNLGWWIFVILRWLVDIFYKQIIMSVPFVYFGHWLGVTTIAGGSSEKSSIKDGPAQNASLSNDFELTFIPTLCALLVSDHQHQLVHQINLKEEDCTLGSKSGESLEFEAYYNMNFYFLHFYVF
jgi:hypothetical protein